MLAAHGSVLPRATGPSRRPARDPVPTPTVLVTGDPAARGPLVAALRRHGLAVRSVSTVALEPVRPETPEGAALDAALRAAPEALRLVVTSPRGARIVLDRLPALGIDPASIRWAAVGASTARPLRAAGVRAILLPKETNGAGLAETLLATEAVAGRTVLLARASAAGADLPSRLAAAGARVVEVVAYRTVEAPERSRRPLALALADPGLAALVFASGSAVRGLVELADREGLERARRLPAVVIGPRTAAVAAAEGFERVVVAEEPAAPALARATAEVVAATADAHPPRPRPAMEPPR